MAACKSKIKQVNHKGVYFISRGDVYVTPGQLVQPVLLLPKRWARWELDVILSSPAEVLAVCGWWPRITDTTLNFALYRLFSNSETSTVVLLSSTE